jgi:hypothetical protein
VYEDNTVFTDVMLNKLAHTIALYI